METLIETAREAVARQQVPRDAVPAAAARAAANAYPAMNTSSHGEPTLLNSNHGSREPPDGSQESYVSEAASSSSSAGAAGAPPPPTRLLSSQSVLSSASVPETEVTSPAVSSQRSNGFVAVNQIDRDGQRPVTPGKENARGRFSNATEGAGSATTSPMVVDSQMLTQGSKRTASGAVKMASKPLFARSHGMVGHSRNTSLDSNMSRIGELSAELKTRLAYAMIKVQNGWEQKSIDEVETIASQRSTPMLQTPTSANFRGETDSPIRRRTSSYDDSEYMASPGMTNSPGLTRTLNGHAATYHNPDSRPTTSSTITSLAPSLAPAPDITPQRRPRRSLTSHVPPTLGSSTRPSHPTTTINAPTTPTANKTRPPGILRLPSQQAEMDAVDSLLFMSSPGNSNGFRQQASASQNSTAMPSPLRAEFAGAVGVKRVAFDERSRSISSISSGSPGDGVGWRGEESGSGVPVKRIRADG
ncbi:hypothetical protein K490DRAFT_63747 [Saccharata proteae CBS 121410]|uniref:Uncharacterized protein n=1 Tax=Saccharata proteae CBS 121410 TaxID=1314787 RepID=A0A6A5YFN7_9PEZI|nr:hypothetical protein K490DRAFT_63747 [Saccharata proteae CBS 121410]